MLTKFVSEYPENGDLVFCVDKFNILEDETSVALAALKWLNVISFGHHTVFAASATHQKSRLLERFGRENRVDRVEMTGGLNKVSLCIRKRLGLS